MSESTTPAQCRDEDWNLARDCGLMAATPGTNTWDAALGRFADGIRATLGQQPQLHTASIMMSRHSRAMLLNILWHHQGGSSPVGQPIRALLGIGRHDQLNDEQLAEAKWIDALLAAQAPAVNSAAIVANPAVNAERVQIISRAVAANGRQWPEQLTSGVMFYEGERITRAEFLAEVRA
ncbi:hypothetical protein [Cupriavidus sp. a3]|uniref:hypothetical protein n=1 Tax=Cupriavidus sp. a3 TaxID=3242158 RepID=UPI003D9C2D9E